MEVHKGTFGYEGYTGRNFEELDEYLVDCINEKVLICLDPEDECDDRERVIAFKEGLRGAY